MNIIGISSFYHDSAASLIIDGKIIAAVQEERFTRIKHDYRFPINSIKYCLNEGKIKANEIDYLVFYEKPFVKFDRILETYFSFAPKGFKGFCASFTIWIKEKLFQKTMILNLLKKDISANVDWDKKILFGDHHLSHLSSAFYPSPFKKSAILSIDGVGEWASTSIAIGNKNHIEIIKQINFPHSLGMLYSAFTYYLGFKVNSGEYKLMGLAPYGKPIFANVIKDNLVKIFDDGSFKLNMKYFDYCVGLKMTNKKFDQLFGAPPRVEDQEITPFYTNVASSIQDVLNEIIMKIVKHISVVTKQKNLCLSGGVALNCISNSKILESNLFDNIWIQPASGDAGCSIGAALSVHYLMLKNKRKVVDSKDRMNNSYLGPEFNDKEVVKHLDKLNAHYTFYPEEKILKKTAKFISQGQVVGWFQGRMEFGPRSLGNRSILGDPRKENLQKELNLKVKFRESFRPFAPSILSEDFKHWFNIKIESPYMLFVSDIKNSKRLKTYDKNQKFNVIEKINSKRSIIPAVTHVDYSSRLQTVAKEQNLKFYKLLKQFKEETGFPILINTSFNVRGEPIVCSPSDAYKCFMNTNIDILVINNFILIKKNQNKLNAYLLWKTYEKD